MGGRYSVFVFLFCAWVVRNFPESDAGSGTAIQCKDQEKCSDCVQSPSCAWCSTPDFKSSDGKWLERCFPLEDAEKRSACPAEHLSSPSNQIQFQRDEALGGDGETPIQLRPQRVKVNLRRGVPFNLTLSFRLAENYPIDMYYLMDLSHSMADDKKTVAQLGIQLSAAMRERTTNFRIGFGSFVDKVVMPFVSTTPHRLQKPCDEREEVDFKCAPPFSYRHTLSLTTDAERFQHVVESSAVSGNLDSPEGGFDAIMQAVVCGEQIGWRKDARKLLIFSTDASFHFAGDGRLAGILEPHDGKCHLDRGEYTHATILDYPSIAQINSKVTEKSIAIIFAVTGDQLRDYERLSRQIQGSTAGELSANSSNVVELVKSEYEKISSEVKLSHTLDEGSSPLSLSIFSHCGGSEGSTTVEGGRCGGVRIGETVSFTAQLTLNDCPAIGVNKKMTTSFAIQVVGLEEQLVVDIDLENCGCACEQPGQEGYDRRSHSCGLVGTLQCGACDCGDGYYGKFCECSANADAPGLSVGFLSNCREENATADCSDRGECFCGACDCQHLPTNPDQKYYGKYCQCDDFSCRRVNGELCSGSDHGKCLCSECKCAAGWTGDACDCSTSTVKCRSGVAGGGGGGDVPICSGRGHCECGRCRCDSPDYFGPHCEECQNCPDKCSDVAKCVLCSVHRNASGLEPCSSDCLPYPEVEVVEFAPTSGGKYCSAVDDEDGCTYYFSYAYDPVTSEVTVKAQKLKSCALLGGAGGWWLGGSVVLLTLIIGLLALLFLWCFRERQARQEYAKFEQDKENTQWGRSENPLYRTPHTTFNNPLHESHQKDAKYY